MNASAVVTRLRGKNNEGILFLILCLFVLVMSMVNHDFFSLSTLYSILRNAMVQMVLALGVLLVIISGGIDVSFTAIAIFAGYGMVKIVFGLGLENNVVVGILIALVIGALLGSINGLIIGRFKLPTLIVTLGTQGIFRGILIGLIGSTYIADLPSALANLSDATIATTQRAGVTTRLHWFVIPVILACILVAFVLSRTVFGRGLFAMGGDKESARRAGFPVARYQLYAYMLVGVLAGVAGVMHTVLSRNANPYELVGSELDVIAAVVLGGAAITGGKGSVTGTVLGVGIIAVINNSLIMLGVPSTFQRMAVGALLLVGLAVQALSNRRSAAAGHSQIGTEVLA